MAWDVFISHATEDKDAVAEPLAQGLSGEGLSVWYDRFSLKIGDSLRESIDRGLAESRFGIVILSSSFFAKHWPSQELNGLAQREVNGQKVILPVWFKLTAAEVQKHSPILADRVAAIWSDGLPSVLKALLAAIRDEPIIQANAESANFEIVHLPPQSFDCLLLPIINRGELRDCSARIRILSAHGRSEYNKGAYLVPWESTGNRKDHTRMPRDESRNLAIAKQDRRSTSISLLGVAGPIAHMTWNDASKERPAFEVQLEVGGNALPPFWVFPTDRTGTIGTSYDAPEANFPETEEPNSDNVLKISYGDTPPFLHIFEYDEKEGSPILPLHRTVKLLRIKIHNNSNRTVTGVRVRLKHMDPPFAGISMPLTLRKKGDNPPEGQAYREEFDLHPAGEDFWDVVQLNKANLNFHEKLELCHIERDVSTGIPIKEYRIEIVAEGKDVSPAKEVLILAFDKEGWPFFGDRGRVCSF